MAIVARSLLLRSVLMCHSYLPMPIHFKQTIFVINDPEFTLKFLIVLQSVLMRDALLPTAIASYSGWLTENCYLDFTVLIASHRNHITKERMNLSFGSRSSQCY